MGLDKKFLKYKLEKIKNFSFIDYLQNSSPDIKITFLSLQNIIYDTKWCKALSSRSLRVAQYGSPDPKDKNVISNSFHNICPACRLPITIPLVSIFWGSESFQNLYSNLKLVCRTPCPVFDLGGKKYPPKMMKKLKFWRFFGFIDYHQNSSLDIKKHPFRHKKQHL